MSVRIININTEWQTFRKKGVNMKLICKFWLRIWNLSYIVEDFVLSEKEEASSWSPTSPPKKKKKDGWNLENNYIPRNSEIGLTRTTMEHKASVSVMTDLSQDTDIVCFLFWNILWNLHYVQISWWEFFSSA